MLLLLYFFVHFRWCGAALHTCISVCSRRLCSEIVLFIYLCNCLYLCICMQYLCIYVCACVFVRAIAAALCSSLSIRASEHWNRLWNALKKNATIFLHNFYGYFLCLACVSSAAWCLLLGASYASTTFCITYAHIYMCVFLAFGLGRILLLLLLLLCCCHCLRRTLCYLLPLLRVLPLLCTNAYFCRCESLLHAFLYNLCMYACMYVCSCMCVCLFVCVLYPICFCLFNGKQWPLKNIFIYIYIYSYMQWPLVQVYLPPNSQHIQIDTYICTTCIFIYLYMCICYWE